VFFLELSNIFIKCPLVQSSFKVHHYYSEYQKHLRHVITNEQLAGDLLCGHLGAVAEVPLRGRRDEQLREHARDEEGHEVHDQLVLVHELRLRRVRQVFHSEQENGRHFKDTGREYRPDHRFLGEWNRWHH
jgi:hypothetical protein